MIEVTGNIWDHPCKYKCVTTNGVVKPNGELVMGAGIALQAKERYPDLPARLGKAVTIFGNKPFVIHEYGIISFPTKEHWKRDSVPSLIVSSAKDIAGFVKAGTVDSIITTRPGCGVGNLVWSGVKKLLEPIFDDDRFIVISNEQPPELSPYQQGLRHNGVLADNPYPFGSDAYNEWREGLFNRK